MQITKEQIERFKVTMKRCIAEFRTTNRAIYFKRNMSESGFRMSVDVE